MNKQQKTYTAFIESVCNKFNCPAMAPALKEGFQAFCEAIDNEGINKMLDNDADGALEFLHNVESILGYSLNPQLVDQSVIQVDDDEYSGSNNIYDLEYNGKKRTIGIECYKGTPDSAWLTSIDADGYIDDGTSIEDIMSNPEAWFDR